MTPGEVSSCEQTEYKITVKSVLFSLSTSPLAGMRSEPNTEQKQEGREWILVISPEQEAQEEQEAWPLS